MRAALAPTLSDTAMGQVAEQIQKTAQADMEKQKMLIKQRVDEQYHAARLQPSPASVCWAVQILYDALIWLCGREKTIEESAQMWAEQLKQKEVLRSEFVARLKEHKKELIRVEELKAEVP